MSTRTKGRHSGRGTRKGYIRRNGIAAETGFSVGHEGEYLHDCHPFPPRDGWSTEGTRTFYKT